MTFRRNDSPADTFLALTARTKRASRCRLAWLVMMMIAIASPAYPQVRRPVPKIVPETASRNVAAGSATHLRLTVALPDGLHVQSDKPRDPSLIRTALTLTPPPGVSIVRTTYPKATDLAQPGRDEPLAVFSGTFAIDVEVAIAPSVAPGTIDIPGELRYQSCTDQVCFLPTRAAVKWPVKVTAPQKR